MLHRFPPRFALLVLLTTAPAAQDQSRLVEGTVRNEAGAPIGGARVRLAVCNGPLLPAVLAAELADSPLPATRSTTKGTFALVMASVHDRLDAEIHGQLALVVEKDGCQPWRELLPSPPSLYTGSDVVLPALRDADRATVKVEAAPGHAFVRLQRVEGDRYMQQGGPPDGECYDLPVGDGGVLEVHVPLIPNPPSVPCTGTFAVIGWTAQLVCPGRTSEPQAVFAGEVISFAAPGGAVATQPARAANGAVYRVARCLHRLGDGSLRWFPAVDGAVTEDPRLPVVAIELADPPHRGFSLPWSGPGAELPDAVPRELRCVDPAGDLVDDVRIGLFAPDALVWTFERLRPLLPGVERLAAPRGTVVLPDSVATRPSAWITAPRHLPQLVLDVRTLRDGGRIVLVPATRTVIARAQDDKGQPVAGAFAYTGPHLAMPDRMLHRDAPWLRADGSVPRTDAEGRCELPATAGLPFVTFVAAGWRFGLAQYDERTNTVTAVGHAVQAWRVRAVSAAGRPVPFANLGAEIWTREPDGSSHGHSICAMADSRGFATILA
ncbi:MAG TPA: hypothetical protein VFT55_13220, partial [Planctomycetota bacterium]|nr:hypothetical protein [Planctomycetota bacterium]